jgi:hypothetical protein
MTTMLVSSPLLDRARSQSASRFVASFDGLGFAHACAPIHADSPAPTAYATLGTTVAVTAATAAMTNANLWLGGDVQGEGFGSTHTTTKRITPGRLEGMT